MGLAARLLGDGGIRRLLLRVWLGIVGVVGVVCAVIAIAAFPGDHSAAGDLQHARACPVGFAATNDCVYTGTTDVVSAVSTYRPGNHSSPGKGTSTKGQYETDITLNVPLTSGRTQVVTIGTPLAVAGGLPAGTEVPVTAWRGSVIKFQVLGAEHDSGANPDFREKRDKLLLAIGLPVAALVLWLLMLSVYGPRVRRGRFLAVDGLLVVLVAVTVGTALGGIATPASITGAAALLVLAASWPAARLGLLGR
jgi:hypothetical protein